MLKRPTNIVSYFGQLKNIKIKSYFQLVVVIIFSSLAVYQVRINEKNYSNFDQIQNEIQKINQANSDLELIVLSEQEKNLTLEEALQEAKEKARNLERDFEDINDNVSDLEKIAKTDKELLQKYSKVYFLNEHYVPSDLKTIPTKWTFLDNRKYEIHGKVFRFLEDLLEDAEDDDMNLQVISAFRSFGEQAQLKGTYTIQYGAGTANTFSADQGYSEHQLGTTVDFTTPEIGSSYSGFENTEEYEWLQKNAYKYGFTMSYPQNNQYYQYEPWHWRFVGKDLAEDLYDDGDFFYDLLQRDIDKYILNFFDR